VNSSSNDAAAHSSALCVGSPFHASNNVNLTLRFCAFCDNRPSNCLFFHFDLLKTDISCLSLVNNSCKSLADWPGLILVWRSALTISSSVFRSNAFNSFVGTDPNYRGKFTCANCVFDVEPLNGTNAVGFWTTNCVYEVEAAAFPECSAKQAAEPDRPLLFGQASIAIISERHESRAVGPGSEVELILETCPVIVVLPNISGYRATVYDSRGAVYGEFTENDVSLAVYFSLSFGKVVISSDADCEFEYWAITWPDWSCQEFTVSTFPSETLLGAHSNTGDVNFTLLYDQDICLFHLSSSVIEVSVKYSTEEGYDFLQYRNMTESIRYTGTGSFSSSVPSFGSFWWHSDQGLSSTLLEIRLSSVDSSLSGRHWFGGETSEVPIVLIDAVRYPRTIGPSPLPTLTPLIISGSFSECHPALGATSVVIDCTFADCEHLGDGGALYLRDAEAGLQVSGCLIARCRAASQGGAIYARCRVLSIKRTSGLSCSAPLDAFCKGHISAVSSDAVELQESSALLCSARCETLSIGWLDCPVDSATMLESLNSSMNEAIYGSSGALMELHLHLSCHFCVFSQNTPDNCLTLFIIQNSDISCVSVVNNSCQSGIIPGLMMLPHSYIVMRNCIFRENVFVFFIGTFLPSPGGVTFIHCCFDILALKGTNSVSFSTLNCIYKLESTSLIECPTRTPMGSRTATISPNPTPTKSRSSSLSLTASHTASATTARTPPPSPTRILMSIMPAARGKVALAPAGVLVMTVSEYPMVVILPEVSNLSVAVFDSAGTQTANFTSPTTVFAVYFNDSVGQIFFTATSFTTLTYFAIKPPFPCPSFYVSSAPIDTWSASQATGNFTLGNGHRPNEAALPAARNRRCARKICAVEVPVVLVVVRLTPALPDVSMSHDCR
jgi:hypothetical protein